MILVDSSVWITSFRGENTAQTYCLRKLLENGEEEVAIADLILLEVLQGVLSKQQAQSILESVSGLTCPILGGKQLQETPKERFHNSLYHRLFDCHFLYRTRLLCLTAQRP